MTAPIVVALVVLLYVAGCAFGLMLAISAKVADNRRKMVLIDERLAELRAMRERGPSDTPSCRLPS